MAGLLDFLNTDDGRLGIGLLAAAGPRSADQSGFGQRLQDAFGAQDNWKKTALSQKMGDLQYQSAIQSLEAATRRNKLINDMLAESKQPDAPQIPQQPQGPQQQQVPQLASTPSAVQMEDPFGQPIAQPTTAQPMPPMQAPAPQVSQPGGYSGGVFSGMPKGLIAADLALNEGKGISGFMNSRTLPTDFAKQLQQSGIDPSSPLGQKMMIEQAMKLNYIAPVNARPGSILRDAITQKPIAFNPHVPDGFAPVFDASGNVTGLNPITGGLNAIAQNKAATQYGEAMATPVVGYRGTEPVNQTKAQQIDAANGGIPLFGAPQQPPRQPVLQPPKIAASPEGSPRVTPVLPPGADKGQVLAQDELGQKWNALQADNRASQTVISRLQNIKLLAPSAITGAGTAKRDMLNGLLSLAGIEAAGDEKTASDLLEKNSAQIVTALRMGQGGAGTDALQTLLSSANPNRHMTKEAITEAADQLIAQQRMVQAKTNVLQKHGAARNPAAYAQNETAFDQNADPRLWQLKDMQPAAQAKYIQSLPPEVAADLLQKRKNLKAIGAF